MATVLSSLSPLRRRMVLLLAGVIALVVLVAGAAIISTRKTTTAHPAGTTTEAAAPAATTVAGAASAPTAGATAAAATTSVSPGPVLLVPGYGGSTSALAVLAAQLRRHGRDAQVVALPGDGTGDLRAQASALGKVVDQARQRTARTTVDLVGYSAGGVVARLYVRNNGGADKVRRVVTLGSPQHGTELAAAGAALPSLCPLACQQLIPDSDLLTQLNGGRETPRGPTFVSLWSDVDQTVVPPDSARLKGSLGMSLQSICSTSTTAHGDLPRDRLVTAIVLGELDGSATHQYTAKDCARLG